MPRTDEFVRQILTATTRSTYSSAEGNFLERYYVDQPDQSTVNHEDTYDEWAIRTGRIFLGINLECISCHDGKNHLDKINLWLTERKRTDLWRQAAFFSKVKLYRPYGDLVDEFVLSNDGKGFYDTSSHSVVRIQRYKADVQPFANSTERAKKSNLRFEKAFAYRAAPDYGAERLAAAVEAAIQWNPKKDIIGGPVDVIVLERTGSIRWIHKKPDCQTD